MKEKIRQEMHLFFLDSNNRKHKEVLKNVRMDASGEEVMETMRTMVALDCPLRSGVRKHTKVISAKIVEVKEIILFEEAPVKQDNSGTVEVKEEIVDEPKEKRVIKPRAPKTEVSLSDMTRLNPMTVLKIMKNDLQENGSSQETVDRYISNALKTQALNPLLAVGKRIDPRIFGPALEEITEELEWSRQMVGQLDQLAAFFSPPEWLKMMEKAQIAGREQAARLFRRGRDLDYEKADAYLQGLLREAQEKYAEYRELERAFPQMLANLLAS